MKNKKGFTLIEMLVYLGLAVFITSGTVFFLISFMQYNARIKVSGEALYFGQRAMDIIGYNIREGGGINMEKSVFGESEGKIVLGNGKELSMCEPPEDNIVCLKEPGKEDVFITPEKIEVKSMEFTKVGGEHPLIKINLDIEHARAGGYFGSERSLNLTSAAFPRIFYE